MPLKDPEPDPPGIIALKNAGEVIRYMLAIATGALVFSAGLLSKNVDIEGFGKYFLVASWFFLAVSVIGGKFAYCRIPKMLSEKNYDLEDKFFVWPGRVHDVTFVFGIICLGVALVLTLFAKDAKPEGKNVKSDHPVDLQRPVLDDIYFGFDDYNLTHGTKIRLEKQISRLLRCSNFLIAIEGHTDERGTSKYNLALGSRRAISVREFLLYFGVPDKSLKIITYGEEKPLCSERMEQCWIKNRRVHFEINLDLTEK